MDLFDHRINLRADRWKAREKFIIAARDPGELLNHVDRGRQAGVLIPGNLGDYTTKGGGLGFWPELSDQA